MISLPFAPSELADARVSLRQENESPFLAFGTTEPESTGDDATDPGKTIPSTPRLVLLSDQLVLLGTTPPNTALKRRDHLIQPTAPDFEALLKKLEGKVQEWSATDRIVLLLDENTNQEIVDTRLMALTGLGVPVAVLTDPTLLESRPALLDGFIPFVPVLLKAANGLLHGSPRRVAERMLRAISNVRTVNPSARIDVWIPPAHLRLSDSTFRNRFEFQTDLLTGLFDLSGDLAGLGPLAPFLDAILHGHVVSAWEESSPVLSRNGEDTDEVHARHRNEFDHDRELFRGLANDGMDALLPIPRLPRGDICSRAAAWKTDCIACWNFIARSRES